MGGQFLRKATKAAAMLVFQTWQTILRAGATVGAALTAATSTIADWFRATFVDLGRHMR